MGCGMGCGTGCGTGCGMGCGRGCTRKTTARSLCKFRKHIMSLTLTPEAQNILASVIDCFKAVALYGPSPYAAEEKKRLSNRLVDLLIESNPDASGLTAMRAEVEAQKADIDGQFAAQREHLAIFVDDHNEKNKAQIAILNHALAAIKLDVQAAQFEDFRS